MDDRELPSNSDESDEDYIPSGAESNPASEEESDGNEGDEVDDSNEEEEVKVNGKRKRNSRLTKKNHTKKVRKKKMLPKNKDDEKNDEENEEKEDKAALTEEEAKKKADSLWSDFLKDTGTVFKNKNETSVTKGGAKEEAKEIGHNQKQEKENKVTVTKVYEFAGEEVKVTKEVPVDSAEARTAAVLEPASSDAGTGPLRGRGRGRGRGGISSVLGLISSKKEKLGTLEKSKLDWDRFKKTEGIEEEIQIHNRGRDGYLDKLDFLQRADIRQFELEKQLRTTRRSTR